MKTPVIKAIAVCGLLFATTLASTAGVGSRKFGGLTSGKKFTLTVKQVTSSQSIGTKTKSAVAVPEGIPKFKNGQKITFKIGKKGELKGPGFSIAYLGSGNNSNSYAKLPSSKTASPNAASVFKDAKGKPIATNLTFYQYRILNYSISGLSINLVGYVLE